MVTYCIARRRPNPALNFTLIFASAKALDVFRILSRQSSFNLLNTSMNTPVIFITGAGKGIGRSLALEFCRRASQTFLPKLFLASRTESDLRLLKSDCLALAPAADVETFTGDISNPHQIEAMYQRCIEVFGVINCLINNAGVGCFKPFLELTPEDYDYMMSTNLKGTFFLTQRVFAEMEKARTGHVFFITSVAAETPFEQSALYCMSKFGQKGFLEVLRLYARKCNVRVTNVMPGAVYTPMWGEQSADTVKRMMHPDDIAVAVVDAYLQPPRTSVDELVLRPVAGDL